MFAPASALAQRTRPLFRAFCAVVGVCFVVVVFSAPPKGPTLVGSFLRFRRETWESGFTAAAVTIEDDSGDVVECELAMIETQ